MIDVGIRETEPEMAETDEPEDDLFAWINSLPKEPTPALREAMDRYLEVFPDPALLSTITIGTYITLRDGSKAVVVRRGGRSSQYKQGHRAATKEAVAWLHERAREMNDPHAQQVLNSAAFSLGVEGRRAFEGSGQNLADANKNPTEVLP